MSVVHVVGAKQAIARSETASLDTADDDRLQCMTRAVCVELIEALQSLAGPLCSKGVKGSSQPGWGSYVIGGHEELTFVANTNADSYPRMIVYKQVTADAAKRQYLHGETVNVHKF